MTTGRARKSLAEGTSGPLAEAALIERRGRAVERARKAFHDEFEMVGDDFDPGSHAAALFRYITIGEAALLCAEWTSGFEADALRTASAALRSAWWMWLEDTDDAMACVRGCLEQTCRARAHRLKPGRAVRVESAGALVTSTRWLEAAGWKRLGVLSRALGEFAHISLRSRWSGARQALTVIQAEDTERSMFTARGHALEAAAYLLAHEVAQRLDMVAPGAASAFREEVTLLPDAEHDRHIEDLLQRAFQRRDTDFGPSDIVRAEPEES
jgi:hypothetical protein